MGVEDNVSRAGASEEEGASGVLDSIWELCVKRIPTGSSLTLSHGLALQMGPHIPRRRSIVVVGGTGDGSGRPARRACGLIAALLLPARRAISVLSPALTRGSGQASGTCIVGGPMPEP